MGSGARIRLHLTAGDAGPSRLVESFGPDAVAAEVEQALLRRASGTLPVTGLRVRVLGFERPGQTRWYHLGWAVENALDRALEALKRRVLEPWVALTVTRLRDARPIARWIYRRGGWITWQDARVLQAQLPLRRVKKLRRQLVRLAETEAVLTWDVVEQRPTPNWLADELLSARWRFGRRRSEEQAKPRFDVDRP